MKTTHPHTTPHLEMPLPTPFPLYHSFTNTFPTKCLSCTEKPLFHLIMVYNNNNDSKQRQTPTSYQKEKKICCLYITQHETYCSREPRGSSDWLTRGWGHQSHPCHPHHRTPGPDTGFGSPPLQLQTRNTNHALGLAQLKYCITLHFLYLHLTLEKRGVNWSSLCSPMHL